VVGRWHLGCGRAGVEPVTMTTGSHVMSLVAGDSVQLDCEFDATSFNLFDNPVLWRKTQLLEPGTAEDTQLNMMGNMLAPFNAQRRFAVDFVAKPPSYTLWLHIAGITQPRRFYSNRALSENIRISTNILCRVGAPARFVIPAIDGCKQMRCWFR